jgi:hypothetical protein
MPPVRQESVKEVVWSREGLLALPGFVEKKCIHPDKQKKDQKLLLKPGQVQKRSANDACQRQVSNHFLKEHGGLIPHVLSLFSIYSVIIRMSKIGQEKG